MTLILWVLAIYRVSYLFARETGPFRIGERWRNLNTGENWVAEGLRCVYCISFWLALPAGFYLGGWPDGILYWLALAGAVVFIDRFGVFGRDR